MKTRKKQAIQNMKSTGQGTNKDFEALGLSFEFFLKY